MVSINTGFQSILLQANLNNPMINLNKLIENMTTGYKINHASDNAANYSISTGINHTDGYIQKRKSGKHTRFDK
ncbi:hypothetical protein IJ182_06630 [bacterium]|nr:hypothetical protein [bacterium]